MSHNPVDPNTIPEVVAYREIKEMIDIFKKRHDHVFSAYDKLLDELSQKRGAADKVVRAKEVSCDDWDLYQFQTKINPDKLYNALGMDDFLRVGGTTSTQTIYQVDKAKLEAAVARGEVPKEVADEVIVRSPRYHAPK